MVRTSMAGRIAGIGKEKKREIRLGPLNPGEASCGSLHCMDDRRFVLLSSSIFWRP